MDQIGCRDGRCQAEDEEEDGAHDGALKNGMEGSFDQASLFVPNPAGKPDDRRQSRDDHTPLARYCSHAA